MTRDEQKFYDKALIAIAVALVAKEPTVRVYDDDEIFRLRAISAARHAEELLAVRRADT